MDPISNDMKDGAQPSDGARPSKRTGATPRLTKGLYIVATPIGNLGDLSPRAMDILQAADVIACEDTRVTGKLLKRYGVSTQMIPYHDHSSPAARAGIIERLESGKTVALVSDAGTPLISDPGYRLVRDAVDAGIFVTTAPGPSSPMAALVLSGLPTDRFLFAGYLPPKDKARRDTLAEFAAVRATLVFLESPKRLASSIATMADVLGDRAAAVAREMTKLHEEVRRGSLGELAEIYANIPAPKGEAVVVIGPPDDATNAPVDLDSMLIEALCGMSVRDAAATVAAATGIARKEVYTRALALGRPKAEGSDDP
ncbi:MAG: 16S rRNA (cytidine1402-2'-O)-methyltransferase [Paracoccaceae bacterium]|jgi:16S rRNA (cytidine1402-2'-O)-methyltransferase